MDKETCEVSLCKAELHTSRHCGGVTVSYLLTDDLLIVNKVLFVLDDANVKHNFCG